MRNAIHKHSIIVCLLLSFSAFKGYAQCTTNSWAGWASSGSAASPAINLNVCSPGSISPPSTGYTYFQATNGTQYTLSATGGTGWTTPSISIYKSTNAGGTWAFFAGSSGSSVTFTADITTNATNNYIVVVNNGNACLPLPTPGAPTPSAANSALLNYTQVVPTVSSVSVNYTCTNNDFTATGGGPFYQWQGSNDNSTWSNISGATATTYSANSGTSPQYPYYRMLTYNGTCTQQTSGSINVLPRANAGAGNVTVSSNVVMGGTYNINGNFTLNSGVTITEAQGCPLVINATNITISGTIDASAKGGTGGSGGSGGSGATGSGCGTVGGGGAGSAGGSTGGGGAGTNGGNGNCVNIGCGFACIGGNDGFRSGAGGGGGGGGGAYGNTAGSGGNGSQGVGGGSYPSAGGGGTGGSAGSSHGTATGSDIAAGGGGGGAGGGGGGWQSGTSGGNGGNGGGAVSLIASNAFTLTGSINVSGANGGNGGQGGGLSDGSYNCGCVTGSLWAGASGCRDNSACGVCTYYTYPQTGGGGGGAGGGAGGGVLIQAFGLATITGSINANGGSGGASGYPGPAQGGCYFPNRAGAGGSGGRIKFFLNPCQNNVTTGSYQANLGSGGAATNGNNAGFSGSNGTIQTNLVHPSYTAPVAGTISANQTFCGSGTPTAFTGTASTGGTGSYTYNWFSCTGGACAVPADGQTTAGVGWTDRGTNATGFTETGTLTSTTTYIRRTINGIDGCARWSNVITVTINSLSTAPTGVTGTTTICNGGSTTLTVSGGSLGTGGAWKWYTGSCGGTLAGTGASITVSPTSTTTYYVRAEGTCNNTACASVTITVNTLSTDPTSAAASPATICNGSSSTLTLTGGGGGTGAVIKWYTGSCGGTLAGTGNSLSVSPTTTTTYYGRYEGTCNNTACVTTTVTVNTLSTAPTGITGTTTICNGGSTTLTVSGGSAGTGATAEWFTGSCGGTSAGTGNSITVSPTSNTTYYVRYNGTCNTTSCASQLVTVNTLSTSPTSASASPATICNGSSSSLTLTGGGGGTGATIKWYTGSCGGTLAGTGNSLSVSPTTTTTYYGRYEGTCNNTTCATVTVNVDAVPTSSITTTPLIACGLTSAALGGNTPSPGTGVWSQFSGPGTSTFSGSTSGSSTATVSVGGTYVFRWTVSNGVCTPATADVTVVFGAGASVPTSGGDKEACYRTAVPNLTATVGAGETIDWYDAASGGSLVKSSSTFFNEAIDGTGPNPIPGTYTYYAEGRNTTSGCVSSTRTAITLTIRSVPVISPTATPMTVCANDNVLLDAGAIAGSGTITNYAWSSGIVGNVSSGTVNPTTTTPYTVSVTNSYSCTNDASVTVTVKSAAALVILPSSTVTTALEQCSDAGWTYYATTTNPDDWLFAIRKNGNSFTAKVDITIPGSTIDHINTTKPGYEHGSYLMNRYWNVEMLSGSISGTVDVKFFYDPSEKAASLSARDAAWTPYPSTSKTPFRWFKTVGVPFDATRINLIDGNSFNGFPNVTLTDANTTALTENGVLYAQFNGITSFSGGTGGYGFSSPGAGLPVKLIAFTATAIENSYVRLDWSTALEINNAGFEIERSTNGSDFVKIGWVKGNDNSTITQYYTFDDMTALQNVRYYYRLKQIDIGNVAFEYSNIATAMLVGDGKTAIGDFIPNPTKERSKIDLFITNDQAAIVDVYEVTGKFIKSETIDLRKGFNTYVIQTEDLSAATYIVSFKIDGQRFSKRLNVLK
ncbi:MAG: hypothetical protein U0T32_09595 [Chitinophagales bacterium]